MVTAGRESGENQMPPVADWIIQKAFDDPADALLIRRIVIRVK